MGPLIVENLVKRYGGLAAVDGVSFRVEPGSITGLIGPNGAGKTTSFNMIAGSERPTSGRIAFDGTELTRLGPHARHRLGILRTFQIPRELKAMTVRENLAVAAPDQPGERIALNWLAPARVRAREAEVLAKADETLAFLGLTHLADALAGTLSGGQKKLLELGRTMMADARLVLLDEPGAGVNPTLMQEIAEMIRRLNAERGYTFCIIEHDMDLVAQLCDPVIVLAEGRVLTQGPMREVREDPRVIDAYFGGDLAGDGVAGDGMAERAE